MSKPKPIEAIIEPHRNNLRRPPIAVTHPHLNAEWLYKMNCGFGPEDFSAGSEVVAWWRCLENPDHIWDAPIEFRARRGFNCPFCSGRRVSPDNCLAACFPEKSKEWHPTLNKGLKPTDVTAHSREPVWWLCAGCSHEWQTDVANRTSGGHDCYRCAKNMLDLRNYPFALRYFDKKKNKGIDPTWLTVTTQLYWKCGKHTDHRWRQCFTKKCSEENFCPFCNNRKTSESNCLANRSPKLSGEWHRAHNGSLSPRDVTATSGAEVWWLCPVCSHSWRATVANRYSNGQGCPECWKSNRSTVMAEVGLRNRIDSKRVEQIVKLYEQGLPQTEIARRVKVGHNTVHRVLKREQVL